MSTLHELYNEKTASIGSAHDISKYRHKLKKKITNKYGDELLFLAPRTNVAEIVIRADTVVTHVNINDKDSNIINLSRSIKQTICVVTYRTIANP